MDAAGSRWQRYREAGRTDARSGSWEGLWWHLLWLFFLGIPLIYDRTLSHWLWTAAATLLFLAIFMFSFRSRGVLLWLTRAAVFALGVALFPVNSFAHTFFIYSGMPGMRANSLESLSLGAVALTASYVYFATHHLDPVYYAIVSIIVLGMQIGVLLSRLQNSQQALEGKDQEIARLAKLAERDRIARDLHDLLGHTLSMIALKSELAYRLAPQDGGRAAAEMREVAAAARQALGEVRQTIVGLRSMGLADALKAAARMLEAAGVKTEQHVGQLPALDADQEHALAQAVLEAGTNIVRHAAARHAGFFIDQDAVELRLRIEDDGRGGEPNPGNGLTGMRERLAGVNAAMRMSSLGPGMRIEIALPLVRPQPA